jgi:hypothetical protein
LLSLDKLHWALRPWLIGLFFRPVFLSVMFTRFLCMMLCMASMAMGHVGMMPRFFMSSALMMLGGFTMVMSRMLVMLSC